MRRIAIPFAIALGFAAPAPARGRVISEGAPPIYQPLLVTSARANGMGELSALIAEPSVSAWRNPGMLPFFQGWQAATTSAQLLPDLTDDIYLRSQTVGGILPGFGSRVAVAAGYSKLDLGKSVFVDDQGNPVREFESFDKAYTVALACRVISAVGAGIAFEWVDSKLSDPIPELGITDGRDQVSSISLGLAAAPVVRLPLGSESGSGFAFGPMIGASYLHRGGDVSYNDGDQASHLASHVHLASGVQFAWETSTPERLLDLRRFAQGRLFAGVERSLKAVRGTIDDGSSITHSGVEVSAFGLVSARWGYVDDPHGDIQSDTRGFGVGLIGVYPIGVRYDWASVPQASGLERAERSSFVVEFRPGTF